MGLNPELPSGTRKAGVRDILDRARFFLQQPKIRCEGLEQLVQGLESFPSDVNGINVSLQARRRGEPLQVISRGETRIVRNRANTFVMVETMSPHHDMGYSLTYHLDQDLAIFRGYVGERSFKTDVFKKFLLRKRQTRDMSFQIFEMIKPILQYVNEEHERRMLEGQPTPRSIERRDRSASASRRAQRFGESMPNTPRPIRAARSREGTVGDFYRPR